MEIKVNISEEEMASILEQAKNDVREEITEEVVKEYIEKCKEIEFLQVLDSIGIRERYKELDKKFNLNSLGKGDKMVVLLYWIMYGGTYKWV